MTFACEIARDRSEILLHVTHRKLTFDEIGRLLVASAIA